MQAVLLALLASVKFKSDKGLVALALTLVLVVGALILHKDIEPKVGLAFLAGAFALPGFFGKRDAGSTPDPAPSTSVTPLPVSAAPDTTVGTLKKAAVVASSALALALAPVACSGVANAVDQVNNPKDDVAMAACRGRARADVEAGADASAAYADYYRCTQEGGLR